MAQAISSRGSAARWPLSFRWRWAVPALLIIGAAVLFSGYWAPIVHSLITTGKLPGVDPAVAAGADDAEAHEHAGHGHAGHDHSHAGHEESNSIGLSPQARKNIGLTVGPVELRSFTRTISVPGIVVERPGRSLAQVTAPMTGIITRIYPLEGEAVSPEQKLFDIRLTHEELVQAQAELLRTIEQLDVTSREITRIEKLASDGALPGKTLLERKYEQQKQQAVLRLPGAGPAAARADAGADRCDCQPAEAAANADGRRPRRYRANVAGNSLLSGAIAQSGSGAACHRR